MFQHLSLLKNPALNQGWWIVNNILQQLPLNNNLNMNYEGNIRKNTEQEENQRFIPTWTSDCSSSAPIWGKGARTKNIKHEILRITAVSLAETLRLRGTEGRFPLTTKTFHSDAKGFLLSRHKICPQSSPLCAFMSLGTHTYTHLNIPDPSGM